jgi:lipid II:glycine glycyltransferase (peptidoglycan interpeptide bridge formation enzyme)
MDLREVSEDQKSQYNKLVTHVIQSFEWGEFRKSFGMVKRYFIFEGNKPVRAFQITFHKIPYTNKFVGYLPKGPFPDYELAKALQKIGKEQDCAFIKIEPDVYKDDTREISPLFKQSPKSLFTKHNFILDLTSSEEVILKNMHPKTRYNIKVAEKHGVKVEERVDDDAFNIYLKLYFETTKRQGYHGHNESYHKKVWDILKQNNMARILIASYEGEPLTAWMLFNFNNNLYYPYGGSSKSHPEVMANNLVAWEAIKLGKKLKLKSFDMWGALSENPDPKDPFIGFHRFKKGYGGKLVEYIGTFDLVLNWPIYLLFTIIDRLMPLKVFLLKLLKK